MKKDLKSGNFKREITFAFYQHLKESNPELFNRITKEFSIRQLEHLVTTPFRMLREVIKDGTFENIRIMYLGLFVIKKARVKGLTKRIVDKYKRGDLSQKLFKYYMTKVIEYAVKNREQFEEKEIEEWMSLY